MVMIPGAAGSPATFGSGISRDASGSGAASGSGIWGEKRISQLLRPSGLAMTTATAVNVVSLVLPAGDWFVFPAIGFGGGAGSATITRLIAQISTVSLNFGNAPTPYNGGNGQDGSSYEWGGASGTMNTTVSDIIAGMSPIHVPTTGVTLYLVAQANFTSGTMFAYGRIEAYAPR